MPLILQFWVVMYQNKFRIKVAQSVSLFVLEL